MQKKSKPGAKKGQKFYVTKYNQANFEKCLNDMEISDKRFYKVLGKLVSLLHERRKYGSFLRRYKPEKFLVDFIKWRDDNDCLD